MEDPDLEALVRSLRQEISKLEQELDAVQKELQTSLKKLARTETYNDDLCQQIEKLSGKLHGFKQSTRDKIDVETQTEHSDPIQVCESTAIEVVSTDSHHQVSEVNTVPDWGSTAQLQGNDQEKKEEVSLADSLKEAAEEALHQSGVVYDDNSGMYYDYNTGYYYDAERALYYDPHSGTYLQYEEASQSYSIHSKVDLTQYSTHPQTSEQSASNLTEEPHIEKDAKLRKHKKRKKKKETEKEGEDSKKSRKKHKRRKKEHSKHIVEDESVRVNSHKRLASTTQEDNGESDVIDASKDADNRDIEMTNSNSHGEMDIVNNKSAAGVKLETDCEAVENDEEIDSSEVELTEQEDSKGPKVESVIEEECLPSEDSELEEGEVSDTESSSGSSSSSGIEEETVDGSLSSLWPPCVRAMVTASEDLDVGSLFIITCSGATIGRVKDLGHAIEIPDVQVSKMHADIRYNEELKRYVLKDHASQNGTFLNDHRLSKPKVMSEPTVVSHLDKVQIGGTYLQLHIHAGTETCDECEPGQVQAKIQEQTKKKKVPTATLR